MTRTISSVLALLVLGGCAQAHDSDSVRAGIYELTVEREADACAPARATGVMGEVAVLVEGGAIDAPVPDMDAPLLLAPRVRLDSATLHAETNRRVPGCASAWVREEWTALEAGAHGFEILHTQSWHGLSDCADARESMPSAPAADCASERRLRYALDVECAAPCTLRLGAAGALACSCE